MYSDESLAYEKANCEELTWDDDGTSGGDEGSGGGSTGGGDDAPMLACGNGACGYPETCELCPEVQQQRCLLLCVAKLSPSLLLLLLRDTRTVGPAKPRTFSHTARTLVTWHSPLMMAPRECT